VHRQRRRFGAIIAALGFLTLAGCGSEPPPPAPLVVEPSRVVPSGRIDVAGPVDPRTDLFLVDSWPAACDLLTDAEITALLPRSGRVARFTTDVEFEVLYVGRFTVPGGRCYLVPDLPDVGFPIPESGEFDGAEAWLTVEVLAAGTPEAVANNVLLSGTPVPAPSGSCSTGGSASVECVKGSLAFRVGVFLPFQQSDLDRGTWTDRFVISGRPGDFVDVTTGDSAAITARDAVLRDSILAPLAAAALTKF
jgi:hypothetical protein